MDPTIPQVRWNGAVQCNDATQRNATRNERKGKESITPLTQPNHSFSSQSITRLLILSLSLSTLSLLRFSIFHFLPKSNKFVISILFYSSCFYHLCVLLLFICLFATFSVSEGEGKTRWRRWTWSQSFPVSVFAAIFSRYC